jgi:hypothetical protein
MKRILKWLGFFREKQVQDPFPSIGRVVYPYPSDLSTEQLELALLDSSIPPEEPWREFMKRELNSREISRAQFLDREGRWHSTRKS